MGKNFLKIWNIFVYQHVTINNDGQSHDHRLSVPMILQQSCLTPFSFPSTLWYICNKAHKPAIIPGAIQPISAKFIVFKCCQPSNLKKIKIFIKRHSLLNINQRRLNFILVMMDFEPLTSDQFAFCLPINFDKSFRPKKWRNWKDLFVDN